MKYLKSMREFFAFVACLLVITGIGLLSESMPAHAQIVNPPAPITAGTGLTKTGNVLSVNYGTSASSALRGDTTSVSSWSTTGALTAGNGFTVTAGTATLNGPETIVGNNKLTLGGQISQQSSVTISGAKGTLAATTSPQTIDSWATSSFFSGHYTVIVKQNTNYQVSDFLVVTDGATATLTLINTTSSTGSAFATFAASFSGGTVTVTTTYASGAQTGSFRLNCINTQA